MFRIPSLPGAVQLNVTKLEVKSTTKRLLIADGGVSSSSFPVPLSEHEKRTAGPTNKQRIMNKW